MCVSFCLDPSEPPASGSVHMKTFHQKIFLFIPGIALGIWALFFLTVLPDVSAADPAEIHCPEQGFQILPERISPLAIAYDRLRAVLSAHGNPKNIPFALLKKAIYGWKRFIHFNLCFSMFQ